MNSSQTTDSGPTRVSDKDFLRVFERVRRLWPAELDVTEITPGPKGGARIPQLTKVHDFVEDQLEIEFQGMDYHLAHAIELAIYTFLHTKIRGQRVQKILRNNFNKQKVLDILNSYEAWEVVVSGDSI